MNDNQLYLISISGNTISNIQLARQAKVATAITANPKSELAKTCDDVITLKFNNTRIQTAGSIIFLANALMCISLVTRFKIPNYARLYKTASKVAQRQIRGRVYVLGNCTATCSNVLCGKITEVLGADVHYEGIEQFSHMGLFSSRKGDTVLIFEKRNVHNEKLARPIKKCGLDPIIIDPPTNDPIGQVIFFIFVSEFLSLHLAKIKNKKAFFFVENMKLRNASSSMIY